MTSAAVLEIALRVGLGGLFVYAGAAKVPDLEQFFWDVHHFGLTSWDVSMVLAMFLPWLEIVAGVALIVRRFHHGAVCIVGTLSSVFFGAVASAWWRGLDLTCGCFGKEVNATNFPQHLSLNGGMVGAAVVLAWLFFRQERVNFQSQVASHSIR